MTSAGGAGLNWVDARPGEDVDGSNVGGYVEVRRCDACDLGADLATVDLLSRLALTARQRGCRLQLRRVSSQLVDLLRLAGLDDVLMGSPDAALERFGQPEQREELGVEERGDLGDPPA